MTHFHGCPARFIEDSRDVGAHLRDLRGKIGNRIDPHLIDLAPEPSDLALQVGNLVGHFDLETIDGIAVVAAQCRCEGHAP